MSISCSLILIGLALGCIWSAYWLMFSVWMLAYLPAVENPWRRRFYFLLAATIMLATLLFKMGMDLVRRRESGRWWLLSSIAALLLFFSGMLLSLLLGALGMDIHWRGFH